MLKTFVMLLLGFCMVIPAVSGAEPPPYSQLDGRPFDPGIDPDIDMFISSWKEAVPRQTFGALIERDILTKGGSDPMKPESRGAVLQHVKRLSYAKLQKNKSTAPTTLTDEQILFYIESGKGRISAGGKSADLHDGVGAFIPKGLEFTMTNTGDGPLTMYMIVEPAAPDYTPVKDMIIKDENTIPIGMTNAHWSHIIRGFFYGDEAKRTFSTLSGMCPVWFDPMTMGQPHSHQPGNEEVWFVVEGEVVILIGKELRRLQPGSAFKIPTNWTTPHSTINVSDDTVKLVWFARHTPAD